MRPNRYTSPTAHIPSTANAAYRIMKAYIYSSELSFGMFEFRPLVLQGSNTSNNMPHWKCLRCGPQLHKCVTWIKWTLKKVPTTKRSIRTWWQLQNCNNDLCPVVSFPSTEDTNVSDDGANKIQKWVSPRKLNDKALPKVQRTQGIECFDPINTFSSKQKLQ